MSALQKNYYTPEQYLEIDRKAERRSEYANGEIMEMAGASREHNLIVTNLVGEFRGLLRGRPCETYSNDMRVKISPVRYAYPDVVVACDGPEFEDSAVDVLLNPVVIMEVLSLSTENDDRSWKFFHYRQLESLTDYVMLSQCQPLVEHYTRTSDDKWVLTDLCGLESVLRLPAIGCELPLPLIYERVEFAPDPALSALELSEDEAQDEEMMP